MFSALMSFFKKSPPPAQTAVPDTLSHQDIKINDVISGLKDAILILDQNMLVTNLNPAASHLLSKTPAQIIGQNFNVMVKISAAKRLESRLDREVYVNATVEPLSNTSNIGWVASLHDITVEHGIEQMRVGFVSIAAHELRTPITSIKGYIEAFMDDYKDKINVDQKSLLDHIKENTDRLYILVENLLNVSRVERGSLTLNLEELDWNGLSQQTVEDIRPRAIEKNIQIEFKEPAYPLPKIKGDKTRLIEVLSNLINNAINYTSPGGKIIVWLEKNHDSLLTHISDTGIGIPPEAIPHLFTKFFRVTYGLTQQQASQGNGLGLFISKSIIDSHHGKIWVNSELGKGSVFSFAIPYA